MTNRPAGKSGSRDLQILALLNQLGDRLVGGEQERSVLKNRLQGFERLFNELEGKAANVERSILERQERIEQEQQRQAEKLEQTIALNQRIEEALVQQARISRRLEKMTQDRLRMIQKLERIEEAVVETRESLNAKALVLLTDKKVADGSPHAPQLPADVRQALRQNRGKDASVAAGWASGAARAAIAAAILLLLIAGGAYLGVSIQPAADQAIESAETKFTPTDEVSEKQMVVAEPEPAPDPLAMGETDLERAFNENPQALASALNDIAPGDTEQAEGAATEKEMEKKQEERLAEAAPLPPPVVEQPASAKKVAEAVSSGKSAVDAFLKKQQDKRPLAEIVKPDPALPEVVKEIEKKAFDGVPEAQHDLAAIYTAGHGGVKTDYAKAAVWFRQAALHGVANAQYNLGVLYHQGLGVKQDMTQAIGWYRAAAAAGHPEAQYNLGIACIEGIGMDYDPRAAADYFEKAARGKVVEAAYNLGLIHENGLLGKRDFQEALYWYKQAADEGSPEGKAALEQLIKSMNITMSDVEAIVSGHAGGGATPATVPAETNKPDAKAEKQSLSMQAGGNQGAPSAALTAQVQEQLMHMGLYPGPADGSTGPVTEDAIRAYQAMNDIQADGRASESLLRHMLSRSSVAANAEPASLFPADDNEAGSRPE